MGFDLHSIREYPADAPRITADYNTNKEKWVEQYKLKNEYDKKNGLYFRNNIWQWRPLWNFVSEHCSDILTRKDIEAGHYNDGYLIDKDKSLGIAKRLNKLLANGTIKLEEVQYENDDYLFYMQNVVNFAKFCEKSKGFEIH